MTTTLPARPAPPDTAPGPAAGPGWPRRAALAGAAVVVVAGIVLRCVSAGPLWLDESITVQIARSPWGAFYTALRHDGSPPLYYVLLKGWMALFGTGTFATRALTSVIAVLSLPVAWAAGREIGGRRVAGPMLLLTAASPWALRYGSETRMYTLLFTLVLLAGIALCRALRAPSWRNLAALTLLTTASAYTHYWSFYLLVPTGLWLLVTRRFRPLAAMVAAVVPFAPWIPTLLFQLRHTGTPWTAPPNLKIVYETVVQWGGPGVVGPLVGLALLGLVGVGFAAVVPAAVPANDAGAAPRRALDPRGDPTTRVLAWLALSPLLVSALLGALGTGGWALRYTAVALPAYLLLAARGVAALPGRRPLVALAVALVCVFGLAGGGTYATTPRTEAGRIAAYLTATARPGDVVGYCPDQLSPAVHRLLPARLGLREISYADPEGPALVDWVDYTAHVRSLAPAAFALQLLNTAGPEHRVWLVTRDGYREWGDVCPGVVDAMSVARGSAVTEVGASGGNDEPASLLAFAAAGS